MKKNNQVQARRQQRLVATQLMRQHGLTTAYALALLKVLWERDDSSSQVKQR